MGRDQSRGSGQKDLRNITGRARSARSDNFWGVFVIPSIFFAHFLLSSSPRSRYDGDGFSPRPGASAPSATPATVETNGSGGDIRFFTLPLFDLHRSTGTKQRILLSAIDCLETAVTVSSRAPLTFIILVRFFVL